jgi:hypothetical protein
MQFVVLLRGIPAGRALREGVSHVLYLLEVRGKDYVFLPMPPELPEVLRAAGLFCTTMTVNGDVYLSVRLPNQARGSAFDEVEWAEKVPSAGDREVECAPLAQALRHRTAFSAEEMRAFAIDVEDGIYVRCGAKSYVPVARSLGCPGRTVEADSLEALVPCVPAIVRSIRTA